MTPRSEWLTPDFLCQVLRLRLVVARLGEVELNGWWGTQDVLGATGAMVFRRGFPRTHAWARAQAVFAVARQRCAERFPDPQAITLWQLPAELEDALDQQWNHWIAEPEVWAPLLGRIAALTAPAVATALLDLNLVTPAQAQQGAALKTKGPALELPTQELNSAALALLALGFGQGGRGDLVVPYLHRAHS